MEDWTDASLVRELAVRNVDALAELYDRHAGWLFSFAARVVRDTTGAEAVLLDVFTAVWQRPDVYDPRFGSVAAWLVTLTRDRALAGRRRGAATESTAAVPAVVEECPVPCPEASRPAQVLADLSVLERRSIELAFYDGLAVAEIADRLGETSEAITTAIHRASLSIRAAAGQVDFLTVASRQRRVALRAGTSTVVTHTTRPVRG